MKFRLIALAALAATGAAHALTPTSMATGGLYASTLKVVRVAGASAQTPMLGAFIQDQCQPGTFDHFQAGSNHHAYSCLLAVKIGNWNIGTPILITKRDKGGSFFGVNPIAQATAQETLDVLTNTNGNGDCTYSSTVTATGKTANYTGCTKTTSAVAHLGLSDVEPAMFQAKITVPVSNVNTATYPNVSVVDFPFGTTAAPLNSTELGRLDTIAVTQTVFGVAVSAPLYAAMQAAQGLTTEVPTMPRAFYAAAVSGFVKGNTTGFAGWSTLTKVSTDDTKAVNICRRTSGSGTQAVSNHFFLNMGSLLTSATGVMTPLEPTLQPSQSGAPTLVTAANVVNTTNWTRTDYNILGNYGTGDVETCLVNAGTSGLYAMGVITLEKDPTVAPVKSYRFVKLDGQTPSRTAAREGAYPLVYAATMQYITKTGANADGSTATAPDKDTIAFMSAIRGLIGTTKAVADLGAPASNGVLALPYNWASTTATCATATGNDALYGSCVERLDAKSPYTYYKHVIGTTLATPKTGSNQALVVVR